MAQAKSHDIAAATRRTGLTTEQVAFCCRVIEGMEPGASDSLAASGTRAEFEEILEACAWNEGDDPLQTLADAGY